MTTMIAELYDARFAALDVKLTRIEGDMSLIKWMLATVLAGVVGLVVKGFFG